MCFQNIRWLLQISLHYTNKFEQNCHVNTYTTGIGVWEQHWTPVSIPVPANRSECFLIYIRVFILQISVSRLFWHFQDWGTQHSISCEVSMIRADSRFESVNHWMQTCLLLFLIPLIFPSYPREAKSMRFGWFIHSVIFGPGWPAVTHCPLLCCSSVTHARHTVAAYIIHTQYKNALR